MKRFLLLADLHCGQVAGLTPPKWQVAPGEVAEATLDLRRECYAWFADAVRAAGPYAAVAVIGDAVDGQGARAAGAETITPNPMDQVKMAAHVLTKAVKAARVYIVAGTPYHVGAAAQQERQLVGLLQAGGIVVEYGEHLWPEADGVIFDLKHKIGGSSIPHGRFTALARDAL